MKKTNLTCKLIYNLIKHLVVEFMVSFTGFKSWCELSCCFFCTVLSHAELNRFVNQRIDKCWVSAIFQLQCFRPHWQHIQCLVIYSEIGQMLNAVPISDLLLCAAWHVCAHVSAAQSEDVLLRCFQINLHPKHCLEWTTSALTTEL